MKKKILITLASIGTVTIITGAVLFIKLLASGDLETLKVEEIDEF